MSRHEIPARWMDAVRQHVLATRGEERDHLLVYDFGGTSVRLGFEDGSYAFYRYAFCLHDQALREVAVFTEHCGYYFLSSEGLEVEVLETVRLHVPVEEDLELAGEDG